MRPSGSMGGVFSTPPPTASCFLLTPQALTTLLFSCLLSHKSSILSLPSLQSLGSLLAAVSTGPRPETHVLTSSWLPEYFRRSSWSQSAVLLYTTPPSPKVSCSLSRSLVGLILPEPGLHLLSLWVSLSNADTECIFA